VADRIPAPPDMPDPRLMLLPSRACLLSVRETLCVARRASLLDAERIALEVIRNGRDRDRAQVAALACVWEATACLELAANVAAPWVDPQIPAENGGWVEMTRYDPGRANRFYESSHNWDDDRYAVLSGHVVMRGSEHRLLEFLAEAGLINPELMAAYEEAERATASFLRDVFAQLAQAWKQFRGYAAAYEHGLLFVPSDIGDVVDEDGNVVPHALLILQTRQDSSMGHVGDDPKPAVEQARYVGDLACDVAEHVADSRLRSVEVLEFDGDQVFLRPWTNPFPYWFRRGAVSEETLALLQRDVTLSWIRVEDDESTAPS
jgi:hypothetical protein